MHKFLSPILSFFLSPFNWIILLLLGACFLRNANARKTCRVLVLAVFLLFSNQWLLDWYAANWQPAPMVLEPGKSFSCAIVPGGFGSPDKDGAGNFNSSADRFIQALRLYKLGHIQHILVSGGNGKADLASFKEGQWAKQEFRLMGLPDSAILVEDSSENTADNARYAKNLLAAHQLRPPYLLISSAHHLPRAGLLFKQAGVAVIPYPCNYVAGRGIHSIADVVPRLEVLATWPFYLKETAGYFWYR